MPGKFKKGMRVEYRHGRGAAFGTIAKVEGEKATITTKRGFKVQRPITALSAYSGEKVTKTTKKAETAAA